MFMGPFAFVSWWPLSQRATHYRCGLMNDVTQTQCWHPCVLGRRDAALLASLASKEWGQGGPGGAGLKTCPSSCRQGAHTPPPHPLPPLSFLSSLSSQWKYGAGQHGNGVDAVINPEVLNGALAFHLNIYLHLNRHDEGPSLPSGGQRKCPKGLM